MLAAYGSLRAGGAGVSKQAGRGDERGAGRRGIRSGAVRAAVASSTVVDSSSTARILRYGTGDCQLV